MTTIFVIMGIIEVVLLVLAFMWRPVRRTNTSEQTPDKNALNLLFSWCVLKITALIGLGISSNSAHSFKDVHKPNQEKAVKYVLSLVHKMEN